MARVVEGCGCRPPDEISRRNFNGPKCLVTDEPGTASSRRFAQQRSTLAALRCGLAFMLSNCHLLRILGLQACNRAADGTTSAFPTSDFSPLLA